VRRHVIQAILSLAGIGGVTFLLRAGAATNPTTVALAYLMVVLFVAATAQLWTAVLASLAAMLCFNYFFLPPIGTFAIAGWDNSIALFSFLIVSIVGSQLSAAARARADEAVAMALERSQLLEERRTSELAHQRAELLSALLASLSHDLRTPLTAIRAAMSNLDSAHLTDAEKREQARVASRELERLTRLFEEILDMARIDAGGVQPQRGWTTPSEIVEAALSHAASAISGRHIEVDAADEVVVEIDPRLTAGALAHLIENAARYASEGPIQIRAWTDEQGLRLEVRDSGPGVQPAERERLFEPFYRGEDFRQRIPGTGMGLAITRGLLAAQGGKVWAENAVPNGACFSIAVPAPARAVVAVG
jgi:K+-sensing histidine kinase KdpD